VTITAFYDTTISANLALTAGPQPSSQPPKKKIFPHHRSSVRRLMRGSRLEQISRYAVVARMRE
jgi:hypothetical protein